jgi:PAS domain-containing protein
MSTSAEGRRKGVGARPGPPRGPRSSSLVFVKASVVLPNMAGSGTASRSLPLILARELASNLATPMFLMDAEGTIVYCNEAAEGVIGASFAELGEIPASEFGEVLRLRDVDGAPIRRRDTPAGIALFERRPSHRALVATGYDGVERKVEVSAYPLFGAAEEMHGVVTIFWLSTPEAGRS